MHRSRMVFWQFFFFALFLFTGELISRIYFTRLSSSEDIGLLRLARGISVRYKKMRFGINTDKSKNEEFKCMSQRYKKEVNSKPKEKILIPALYSKYEEGFKDFVELAKKITSRKPLIIYTPINKDKDSHRVFFAKISAKYNVDFIDLSKPVRESAPYDYWTLYPEDGHYSRYGYKIIAKNLMPYMITFAKEVFSTDRPFNRKFSLNTKLPKNKNKVVDHNSLPYKVTTNSLGFRSSNEPGNGPLVIVYGDSMTEGPYVSNKSTYPELVQGLVNDDPLGDLPKITVLNAGVSGSTIFHELEVLKNTSLLRPDLVVLQVLDNDVWGVASAKLKQIYPVDLSDKNIFRQTKEEDLIYKLCGL